MELDPSPPIATGNTHVSITMKETRMKSKRNLRGRSDELSNTGVNSSLSFRYLSHIPVSVIYLPKIQQAVATTYQKSSKQLQLYSNAKNRITTSPVK